MLGVTPRAPRTNNGGPPAPVLVEQDQGNNVLDITVPNKVLEEREIEHGPESIQAPLIEDSESLDRVPPPQTAILRPG